MTFPSELSPSTNQYLIALIRCEISYGLDQRRNTSKFEPGGIIIDFALESKILIKLLGGKHPFSILFFSDLHPAAHTVTPTKLPIG